MEGINLIERGDYVRRTSDGYLHRVENVEGGIYYLDDGGCCGDDDVAEVLLESEGYDEFYRQERA